MNFIKLGIFSVLAVGLHSNIQAQYAEFLPIKGKVANFVERYKILNPTDSVLKFATVQPYKAKEIIPALDALEKLNLSHRLIPSLTDADQDLLSEILDEYAEYAPSHLPTKQRTFFSNNAHLYQSHAQNVDFHIDPMLNYQYGHSSDGTTLMQMSQGFGFYGNIKKNLSYYGSYTYNLERDPSYVQAYEAGRQALPGVYSYRKKSGNKYEYNDFRGGIAYQAGRHFNFQLAYDKLFIGDGIRTMFISDFSSPYLYFKSDLTAGKIKYSVGFAKTTAPYGSIDNGLDVSGRPANYVFYQYITWQTTKWLRLGFHQNNTFNSKLNGGFQIGMLNPFIFNRAMSSMVGNSGKSSIGLDFNANVVKNVSVYGQALINEFESKHFFSLGTSSWRNKRAAQFGVKYANAFTIENLDIQGEFNTARPFTFTDKWVVNNFTNNNMPLAHPLGANFTEFVGKASYHPIKRLFLAGQLYYAVKGYDSASYATVSTANYGGDLFRSYLSNRATDMLATGDGVKVKSVIANLSASWALIPNLYLDGSFSIRQYKVASEAKSSINYFTFGVRWNMAKREFFF